MFLYVHCKTEAQKYISIQNMEKLFCWRIEIKVTMTRHVYKGKSAIVDRKWHCAIIVNKETILERKICKKNV